MEIGDANGRLHADWRKTKEHATESFGHRRASLPTMPTMAARAALFALCLGACTRSDPSPRAEPSSAPADVAKPASEAKTSAPTGAEILEGTIVDEGPIGDGACVQKSYEIAPAEGARVWIHFERCGDAGPSPAASGLEGLDVGATYRFTVRRGASKNFGGERILLAAEKR